MKLWILSDLHDDRGLLNITYPQAYDVFVCAGDCLTGDIEGSIEMVAAIARGKPSVFVAGNHEWQSSTLEETLELGHAAATRTGVHFLECDSVDLGDVRFAGATLWTPDDVRFAPSVMALALAKADVIVTHFPPAFPKRTPLGGARLWICGHHHGFADVMVPDGRRRLIRNALGYRHEAIEKRAREDFVVEI